MTTDRLSLPEQWTRARVTANLVNVALSAAVGADFDDLPMIRSGSIVGLATRLTAACAAGTLTATVTKNGVAQTLAVVTTSGANASGGQVTQVAGVDTFVAGDLIGIQLTTSSGWLPVTTNLHAWLEIEEEV